MEITKNVKSGEVITYKVGIDLASNDGGMDNINEESKHSPPTLSDKQQDWLNRVCVHINQNDFDTCRNAYSDKKYDIRNEYNQAYNTYLWEFEHC